MNPREGLRGKVSKILYLCMRLIFDVLHSFTWKVVGRPKEYKASAEVFKILLKFRPCYYTKHICNNEDFLGVHESFCHPDIVLQDNIYFYSLNESEACFVDCGETDVFNDFSFTWGGLFKGAVRIIVMPISSFHAIAKDIQIPNIPTMEDVDQLSWQTCLRIFQTLYHYQKHLFLITLQNCQEMENCP